MKPLSYLFVLLGLLVLSMQKTGRCEQGADPSNLPCTGAGTFPIPGSCHSYYVCRPFGKSLHPYPAECDPDTIFDEVSKECRTPSMVVKSSRCVADVTSRTRRNVETISGNTPTKTEEVPSVSPADNCLFLNEVSMCNDVNIVNRYSTHVISTPFSRDSFDSQGLSIIDAVKYNGDLETAQNNVNPWNSIMIGINQITQLATQYTVEFDRMYGIYQKNVGEDVSVEDDVSKQGPDEAFIKMLEDDITKLEKDIKASEDALQSANIPLLKEYFTNLINSLQKELATKQQQLRQEVSGEAKAASDLDELSYFIDLAKRDAGNVEDLAKSTSDRVQILLENLHGDSVTFEDYNSSASLHHQALSNNRTEETKIYKETVKNITDETARLDKEIQDMENEVKNLRDGNEKLEVIMQDLVQKRNATIATACESLNMTEQTTECIQANSSYSLDLDEDRKKLNQSRIMILKNLDKMTAIIDLNRLKKGERYNLTKSFPSTDTIEHVEAELGRLRVFLNDVNNLKGDLHSSLTSLSEILKVLQGVQCHFGDIGKRLTLLTDRANAADNDEDKQVMKTDIEQDVSRIKAQIQQLSGQISELKECA